MRSPRLSFRFLLVLMTLAGLLLAACGDDGGQTAAATDDSSNDGATRTVHTARGDVEIPAEPQRMVVDWVTFDNLIALDHDLGTIADVFELTFFLSEPDLSPHLTAAARDLDLEGAVGATYELNAEALAALEPDVILMAEDQAPEEDVLAIMEKVAPVVVYDLPDGHKSFAQWESGLLSLAEILGGDVPDTADAVIADFEAELEEVREKHADVVDDVEVSIGNIVDDAVRLSMEGRNIGTEVVAALGLARPAAQLELEIDEYYTVAVSPERLPVIDADILFLEQRQEDLSFLESNPLFQGLGAVEAGNVHFVSNYWEFGGAGSARHVLDDIDTALEAFTTSGAGA